MCGRVVNTLTSGSGGPRVRPRQLRCVLRQVTLLHFISLHPGVFKWVPATYCWEKTCKGLASHVGGLAGLLGMLHAKETGISPEYLGLGRGRCACTFFFLAFVVDSAFTVQGKSLG